MEHTLFCPGFFFFNATGSISLHIIGISPFKCGVLFSVENKGLDF